MTATAVLRSVDGVMTQLDLPRWLRDPAPEEERVLNRVVAPVLDVGCGPGRHALALAERNIVVLGVEAAPSAAGMARARGIPVLERSVFDRLPGEGRWGSALLLDGNIGIGGSEARLLARLRALLVPGGRVLAELAPPQVTSGIQRLRVERAGLEGPWFEWAVVSVTDVDAMAEASGFGVVEIWEEGERWFAELATL